MQERLLEAREARRLVHHFGEVLRRLQSRDTGALLPRVRRRRALQIRALSNYRARGRFPANDRQREPTPIFVDGRGTHCAMAHLVQTSGARRLVERIASRRNFATIRDLGDDGELREWLRAHGLTVAEVSVGDKVGNPTFDVEKRYGPEAPTTALHDRFASLTEGETLLVSLGQNGMVLGTAWPVFRGTVSLENGNADMAEAEAASLLMSATCRDGLRALRQHGVHPAPAPVSAGGCGHCHVSPSASLEVGSAGLVLTAALATATLLRRR